MNESNTFYRDGIEDLTEADKERLDTFAACLGFGPKYIPQKEKTYPCPSCGQKNAYYKEIHPDTDINEIVLYCPYCKNEHRKARQ